MSMVSIRLNISTREPEFCNLAQTQGRPEKKPPEAEPAGFIAIFHRKGVSGHSRQSGSKTLR